MPPGEPWQTAVVALLQAASLPWHDTDKKGRPRQRDCRPYLLDLELLSPAEPGAAAPEATLRLQAAIDPQGRSLRPQQLAHWLGDALGRPLRVVEAQRRELVLRAC
jgi:hypothetical protein